jgi:hypothetical protein
MSPYISTKSILFFLVFSAHSACLLAQTGIVREDTYSFGTGALLNGSEPLVHVDLDNNYNRLSAGHFSGTRDFDQGAATFNLSATSWSPYLQKTDASGNFQWAKSWNATFNAFVSDIETDSNGEVFVTGYHSSTIDCDPGPGVVSFSTSGINNTYLSKFDANGNFLWARHFNCTGNAHSARVFISPYNSRIYVFGAFTGTMDIDPGASTLNITSNGGNDGYCVELDPSGNYLRHWQIGASGADKVNDVLTDINGNVVLGGSFFGTVDFDPSPNYMPLTSLGQTDGFAVVYAPAPLLLKQIRGTGFDAVTKIFTTSSGFYLVGTLDDGTVDLDPGPGTVNFFNNNNPTGYIVQLDQNVNYQSHAAFSGSNIKFVSFSGTANGTILASGYFKNSMDVDPGVNSVTLSSASANMYDEILVQLDGNLNYMNHEERNSLGISEIYETPSSMDIRGNKLLMAGGFSGTHDLDLTSVTANFTASSSFDNYISLYNRCLGPTLSSLNVVACSNYTSPSGNNYFTSGVYTDTILNYFGCDSIITINLTVNTPITPTITATVSNDSICGGDQVTFTANIAGGGANPLVEWYRNGIVVSTGLTYTTSAVANLDQFYAILNTSESCFTSPTATSNAIEMVVGVSNANASVNIVSDIGISVCSADTVEITANYFLGGNYPQFAWYFNGNLIANSGPQLQLVGLQTGDQVSVILTSSDGCLTNQTANSNVLSFNVNTSVVPEVIISGPTAICTGEPATFSAFFTGGGSNPQINWYISGNPNPAGSGAIFTSASLLDGDIVQAVLVNNDVCAVPNFDISNSMSITISPSITPSILINPSATVICEGESISFTSSSFGEGTAPYFDWYVNGTVVPNANGPSLILSTLNDGDLVSCVLTTNLSCATQANANSNTVMITVNPNTSSTQNISICYGTTYTYNGNVYSFSGNYSDTLINANGCDSIVSTLLNVYPQIDNSVSFNGMELIAQESGAQYQWIDCVTGMAISGATSSSYPLSTNGSYAVVITKNGCVDTSDCMIIDDLGLELTALQRTLKVFPNPNTGKFQLVSPTAIDAVFIYDVKGRCVFTHVSDEITDALQIDLSTFDNGLYQVVVLSPQGSLRQKVSVVGSPF